MEVTRKVLEALAAAIAAEGIDHIFAVMGDANQALEWQHVKWDAGVIERSGKHGKVVRVPITDTIREIIWPLRGQHPRFVFTFVAERTIDKMIRGKPYRYVKGERRTSRGFRVGP
jgi:integrase